MNDYRTAPVGAHETASQQRAADTEGLRGFTRRLVEYELLSRAAAERAEHEAREAETSLLQHVIDTGLVTARQGTLCAAWEYGLPLVDLDALRLASLPPASEYPEKLLRKLCVVPLSRRSHRLTVAVPFPSTLALLDELQFATGLSIEAVLCPVDQLMPVLEAYLAQHDSSMMNELAGVDDAVSELEFEDGVDISDERAIDAAQSGADDAPIVKFVNKILLDAIRRGASDIHFEPYETSYRVRMRVDGMLMEAARPPFAMRSRIAARLKVMARLDISERRLPQDGAIKLKVSKTRSIDFRVNSLPTVYGEKIVLRILDPTSAQIGIDALGFTPEQRALYEGVLDHPQGMILVTGPTGSGKTVTLYTGLNILNEVQRNICTAEDPVEIKVPGVNQVNVLPKIGLDFASALRAFLRQDPDVVMVGEIRDLETAEIAVKASQTGHLVLSTVHTNSAAETLTRLANMGVPPFNIASSVSLIIAQRLARRLCKHCRQEAELPREALLQEGFTEQEVNSATVYEAVGCKHCTHGYKGRVGIYEVVPISNAMSQLIMRNGNSMDFDSLARQEGHPDLRRSGLLKVMQGITSLTEVNRVTKD
ncbi:type IV-A pilus assembly ATPase PilB [Halomonas sp. MCCC 1A17488]|uniref:type IV-A pilus assembly ATPase PilB n=1 Tax=unclassified Halomonas TaxID=2609666 RepID=UPI0018D23522|nr:MULTISPECIES: type IV-A pilus assembly ATPase PilB [unclassified Halomonas]MCE8014948.1 type IV-A pilus assembly ATPase PilB [Halomonas sp. MCCC 1A17488]MCG3238281.1 type IV-A pilus assembly ATPase PilB [Halomonas sp. MCCC 1A17488]QPP47961.1 type IV-A pilus assembly ATPase PilB [Halomonas sp. SS10-MC5]